MSPVQIVKPSDIDDLVVALLKDTKGPEPAAFVEGAEQRLTDAVMSFAGSRDLMIVVQRLISIAYQLEVEEKCPTAAQLIALVVERGMVLGNLQAIAGTQRDEAIRARVDNIGDTAETARAQFSVLTGGATPKRQIRPRIRPRIC